MVVTHFVLAGRGITGAIVTVGRVTVGGEVVGGASVVVVVERLSVSGETGLVSVVWISARRARAVLSLSRIWSISS